VEDLVAMVGPQAQEKGLELVCHVDDGVPGRLRGDQTRFSQVLLNLLNNAVKFTEEGQVLVEVSCDPEGLGDGSVTVSVTDSGPGVAERARDRLFLPFTQADKSVSRRHGGSGLGLAIASRLVELMGGSMGYESSIGGGSRFWFEIPADVSDAGRAAAPVVAVRGSVALLYEPRVLTREALRASLARLGFEVLTVGRRESLFSRLSRSGEAPEAGSEASLVVLSLGPEEQGAEEASGVHERLRRRFTGPAIFLAAIDRAPPPSIAADALCAWLSKPARRSTLRETVARLLHRQPLEAETLPALPRQLGDRGDAETARVLYVEDNPFNRRLFSLLMERHGVATDLAASGGEALEMLEGRAYGVVFMDFHMPGMDGAETAWRMRRRLGDACPPVVVVTADVFLEHAAGGGVFDDKLLKPISELSLERVLQRWLRPEPGSGAAQRPSREVGEAGPRIPDDMRAELEEELGRLHRSIGEAAAQKDRGEAADLAHQLQGLAGVYGLRDLASDAARLAQTVRRGGDGAEITSLLDRMRESLGALRAEPELRSGRGGRRARDRE
jgi:CheY-like chemotaxis protein/HPt (histidine-containing phosphotransfer) domain-containing protein